MEQTLAMGIATAFNVIVIISKYRRLRVWDATLDLAILSIFAILLGGSTQSLANGTVASCIISMYLYVKPIDISVYEKFMAWIESFDDEDDDIPMEKPMEKTSPDEETINKNFDFSKFSSSKLKMSQP